MGRTLVDLGMQFKLQQLSIALSHNPSEWCLSLDPPILVNMSLFQILQPVCYTGFLLENLKFKNFGATAFSQPEYHLFVKKMFWNAPLP